MKTLIFNVTVSASKNANFVPSFGFDFVKGMDEIVPAVAVLGVEMTKNHTITSYDVTVIIKNDEQGILNIKNIGINKIKSKIKLISATNDEGFATSIQGRRVFVIKTPANSERKINIKEGMRKKSFVKKMNAAKAAKRAIVLANTIIGANISIEDNATVTSEN